MNKAFLVISILIITSSSCVLTDRRQDNPRIEPDNSTVKVAVIDTGFEPGYTWDTDKTSTPKICPDQLYNFVNVFGAESGKDTRDDNGHGTHVAGLIAKNAEDADYCLVIMKFYAGKGHDPENLHNSNAALKKALKLKVDIVNFSGGGITRDDEECETVKKMLDSGIIIVAAAGNESSDLAEHKYYPALCDSRVLVVGSIDADGKPSSQSNSCSDPSITFVTELGGPVYSTLPHGKFGYMQGTSQSTAIVTGKLTKKLWQKKMRHE
jgi:major intracellular serine protease